MINVVILDFDDTLCLTEEACFKLENEIAEEMGFPLMSRNTHQKNWGLPIRKAIKDRIPGIDVTKFMEKLDRVVANYSSNGQLDSISEKNLKALDKLKNEGKKIAILTNRSLAEVRHFLQTTHPLYNRVEIIYHSDNSKFLKPDPRVFDQILTRFKTRPKECVYVGDVINDVIVAKKAGLHFIATLESGLRTKKDFEGQDVDYFANKFTDIVGYILQH